MSKPANRRKFSHFMLFFFCAFVCFCIVAFAETCVDIKESKENLEQIQAQVEIKKAENEKLKDMLDNSNLDSYVVKIAHDELGYVFPDERVYYDQQLADN